MSRFNADIERFRESCRSRGWDSYGANPVTEKTIEAALRVGELLEPMQEVTWVVPTVDGAIQFSDLDESIQITVEVVE